MEVHGVSATGDARPRARAIRGGRVLLAEGDPSPRWRPGERLEDVWLACVERRPHAVAVERSGIRLTYRELHDRAVQAAAGMLASGLTPGDRVGLLISDPAATYPALLGALLAGLPFVPLDAAFPPERIAFIADDAGLRAVITDAELAPALAGLHPSVSRLRVEDLLAATSPSAGPVGDTHRPADELCYVIYTSGTTGQPKGVAISHASIVNFVRVAAESYGVRAGDRVYQGLTIAFDFAVEEIWVAWLTGATLVPRPGGANLVGPELRDFLLAERVSALCCVPTLLGTIDPEGLESLRFVLVSGESCPADLVARWHRAGRRLLNVYGPTEATVSASWTVLDPARPVTIGVPLPTYALAILDPESDHLLPVGAEGEIAIGGIGLADGYLNLPERTERAFVPDIVGLEHNPSGRLYRTGDLGVITEDGEVAHRGRIDTQVKIRGYRIETEEIEAALRSHPDVAQALVTAAEGPAGTKELAAYAVPAGGGLDRASVAAHLRAQLPDFAVPAYLETLDDLPRMPSGKLDLERLPAPATRLGAGGAAVPPDGPLELALAETLGEILGAGPVSVEADMFVELGLSSLLLARWTAILRRRDDLRAPGVREVYRARTIRALAQRLAGDAPDGAEAEIPPFADPDLSPVRGTARYVLCGALQGLFFLLYAVAVGASSDLCARWITAASGVVPVLARAEVCGAATLLAIATLPVAAKWLVLGRFRPGRVRIWSLAYLRFWVVKTLIVANPLIRLLDGTPFYGLYLRALGARVGRGAVILTGHVPVAADLLEIGAGAVIRKEAFLNGYRARDGAIEFGPVRIGERAFVGEHAVLDIDTALGAGAQLGHASSLAAGQRVPAGEVWHGSPGRPAPGHDYQTVPEPGISTVRRWSDGVARLLSLLLVLGPLEALAGTVLLTHPRVLHQVPFAVMPAIAAALVIGGVVLGTLAAGLVPRLLRRAIVPGRVYPLPGWRFSLQRTVARVSSNPVLYSLFGDSSAITRFLRWIGYDLGRVVQTGSNFGTAVKHEVPTLCHVGSGTMVSDGLSMLNLDCSSTAFRVRAVRIAERNYLGNEISWPADARVGENCLIATKALLPITGELRRDVGLLGSPAFEIPRHPEPHPELQALMRGAEGARRLRAKNRHNAVTALLYLLTRIGLLSLLFLSARIGDGLHGWADVAGSTGQTLADLVLIPALWFIPIELATIGFRRLRPRTCAILEPAFWAHERFWKVPSLMYLRVFDGTPLKNLLWRALGVRIGGRVFDDGARVVERSLVSIGRGACLNMGCSIQAHSLEDGIFKSDRIEIGDMTTIGTGAVVHYATRLEERAVLEADAFLMKGSVVRPGDRWRGNPAALIQTTQGERN